MYYHWNKISYIIMITVFPWSFYSTLKVHIINPNRISLQSYRINIKAPNKSRAAEKHQSNTKLEVLAIINNSNKKLFQLFEFTPVLNMNKLNYRLLGCSKLTPCRMFLMDGLPEVKGCKWLHRTINSTCDIRT